MKAIFTYFDINGEHSKVVNVVPVNDDFEVVEDSDIFMDTDTNCNTYHRDYLEFIESEDEYNMRKITATPRFEGYGVFSVYITDEEAIAIFSRDYWSGFSVTEALRNANVNLNSFGIEAVIESESKNE